MSGKKFLLVTPLHLEALEPHHSQAHAFEVVDVAVARPGAWSGRLFSAFELRTL